MSNVEQTVKRIVAQRLRLTAEEIKNQASLVADLGADSLAQVEMLMAVEKAFGMSIPDQEAAEITTIQQAIDYVIARQPQTIPPPRKPKPERKKP